MNTKKYIEQFRGWAKHYEKCTECGTQEVKHRAKGLCYHCYGIAWQSKNYERMRVEWSEYSKTYYQKEGVKDRKRAQTVTLMNKYPERAKARQALRNAIARGLMKRGSCIVCGVNAEGHHEDYSKPLDVIWLCRSHHEQYHHGKLKSKYTTSGGEEK